MKYMQGWKRFLPTKTTGFFIASVVICDQLTKGGLLWLAERLVLPFAITPFFNLVKVYNPGISFGMFQRYTQANLAFTLLTLCLVAILWYWLCTTPLRGIRLALSCNIGGALGNLCDRFTQPGVIDFIELHVGSYYWPAFNVADAMICGSAFVLVYLTSPFLQKVFSSAR